MQLDSESRFGGLITHRIRRDQRSRVSRWISKSTSLAVIFVDPIRGKQRRAGSYVGHRFYEEVIVPYVVQTVAKRMLDAVEEVIDYRLAVYPMIVIAGAK